MLLFFGQFVLMLRCRDREGDSISYNHQYGNYNAQSSIIRYQGVASAAAFPDIVLLISKLIIVHVQKCKNESNESKCE